MKFDEDGVSIPGTYPISTVRIGAWSGDDDTPLPTVESAVCDVCEGWASRVWTATRTKTLTPSFTDVRISRVTRVTVFVCPEHFDEVGQALCDEYGSVVSRYEHDELAAKVDHEAGLR